MEIELLAFGIVREILGSHSIKLDVEEGTTVGELRLLMPDQYPKLRGIVSFAIAVNGDYAADETIVASKDEIAIIPPVSGG